MLQYKYKDIHSVIQTPTGVYVSPLDGKDISKVKLIFNDEKFDLVPVNLKALVPNSALDLKSSIKLNVKTKKKRAFAGVYKAWVNHLPDWYLDGVDTLQIECKKDSAPMKIEFPKDLVAKGGERPMVLEARIASHRVHADFLIEIKDSITGVILQKKIVFEPEYTGGKSPDKYQAVSVAIPKEFKQASVRLAIDFHSSSEPTSSMEAYFFLHSIQIREQGERVEPLAGLLAEADMDRSWYLARVDGEIGELEYAFLESESQISVVYTKCVDNTRAFFSEDFYHKKNTDIDFSNIDPFSHYLLKGWMEKRNPGPEFSVREYLLRHPDIEAEGCEPLTHYANLGKKQGRSLGTFEEKILEIWQRSKKTLPNINPALILPRAQDLMVPMDIIDATKLVVMVIPEHNAMSGGIYSMFSIADHLNYTRHQHGHNVLVMTRPNPEGITYVRNSAFTNSQTVLRFEQLPLFREVSELQLHIPEYATVEFVRRLSPELMGYLMKRDNLHINILNQNTRLMPHPDKFRDIRRIADTIGQSVSHHAFFGQEFANHFDLPSLLLPAYTDLTPYPSSTFDEKENLIIYSDDEASYKQAVLEQLEAMGDYKLVKIKDMTFDTYMNLATRCRFSVSFGEGFDGYVAQPMYQGGIGFALYNEEFFPDSSYINYENFFSTEEEMVSQIVSRIRHLESDKSSYESLNSSLREKWDKLYSLDDYFMRIGKLVRKEYEIYPTL